VALSSLYRQQLAFHKPTAEVIEHSVLTFTSPAYAGLGNVHVTSNNSKYSAFWLMMS